MAPPVFSAKARRSRSVRVLVWLAALAPVLAFAYLYLSHRLPGPLRSQVLQLSGEWKAQEGNDPGLEAAELDDRGWRTYRLPGPVSKHGFTSLRLWLRRHFTLPAALHGQRLFLNVGDLNSGLARVFLNGHYIGSSQPYVVGAKSELRGADGWSVPAEYLRSGDNVLALQIDWTTPDTAGVLDGGLYLGAHDPLQSFVTRTGDLRRFLQQGTTFLCFFLLLVFVVLLAAEWDAQTRGLYTSCVALLIAVLVYLTLNTGVFVHLGAHEMGALVLAQTSMLLMAGAVPEFITRVNGQPNHWVQRVNRVYVAGTLVLFLTPVLFGGKPFFFSAVFLGHLYLMMLFCLGISVWRLIRHEDLLAPLITSATLCMIGAGLVDILRGLGILEAPRMFPLGIASTAIMASVVLIANFTIIAFRNRELSASLQTANAELSGALLQTQEANRLKSEFVASVSHELRTPLNSVVNIPEGMISLFQTAPIAHCASCESAFDLAEGEQLAPTTACPHCTQVGTLEVEESRRFRGDADQAVRYLRQVHSSGTHLMNLVNDLLDFSKLEAGRMAMDLAPTSLMETLEAALQLVRAQAEKGGVRMVLERREDLVPTRADREKLVQVFLNLIGNAIKFSPPTSTVTVRVENLPEGRYRISVRDQGIGIAREHHAAIFDSFRQVDGTNTRRFGGAGLGLAIAKKLVEAHEGEIGVESAPGAGSTFYVVLKVNGPGIGPASLPLAEGSTSRSATSGSAG